MKIAVVVVGREILSGGTRDANAHWICSRISRMGLQVERVSIIDDDTDHIALELGRLIRDGYDLILFTGGLGPTFDDLTLQGVASGLGLDLEEQPEAVEFVRKRYAEFAEKGYVDFAELTPERRKMASLPKGSRMLTNPAGSGPGVWIDGEAAVICLPGVPREMQSMFSEHVAPHIAQSAGVGGFYEMRLRTDCGDESVLVKATSTVRDRFPDLYIKSHPTTFAENTNLEITISAWGDNSEDDVRRAADDLVRELRGLGVSALQV